MRTARLIITIGALALGLALQSAAWGYSLDASTLVIYKIGPNGYTAQMAGAATDAGIIVPGASGVGSSLVQSYGPVNGLSYSVSAGAVQDYLIFYAHASSQLTRDFTGGNFEVLQAFATGKFSETLTISGAATGVGQLMLGWDVSGSSSKGSSGDARLIMHAATSNTSSQTPAITSNGHYFLDSPLSFTFGTAFNLTVESTVFAAVGYDNTSNTGPTTFSDLAWSDFLHTVILSSAGVSDSAGNPLANFTITTASGRPFPVAALAPVPSTLLLLGPALAGLAVMRRRIKG
jgi:hypothetical protein